MRNWLAGNEDLCCNSAIAVEEERLKSNKRRNLRKTLDKSRGMQNATDKGMYR